MAIEAAVHIMPVRMLLKPTAIVLASDLQLRLHRTGLYLHILAFCMSVCRESSGVSCAWQAGGRPARVCGAGHGEMEHRTQLGRNSGQYWVARTGKGRLGGRSRGDKPGMQATQVTCKHRGGDKADHGADATASLPWQDGNKGARCPWGCGEGGARCHSSAHAAAQLPTCVMPTAVVAQPA